MQLMQHMPGVSYIILHLPCTVYMLSSHCDLVRLGLVSNSSILCAALDVHIYLIIHLKN